MGLLASPGEFDRFERDPYAALIFYHSESGLLAEYEDPITELAVPTDTQIKAALDIFIRMRGLEAERHGCADCEIDKLTCDIDKLRLGNTKLDFLKQGSAFEMKWNILSMIGREAYHIIKHLGSLYAVAPALIDRNGNGFYCSRCLQVSPKKHSRFLDFDYGRP